MLDQDVGNHQKKKMNHFYELIDTGFVQYEHPLENVNCKIHPFHKGPCEFAKPPTDNEYANYMRQCKQYQETYYNSLENINHRMKQKEIKRISKWHAQRAKNASRKLEEKKNQTCNLETPAKADSSAEKSLKEEINKVSSGIQDLQVEVEEVKQLECINVKSDMVAAQNIIVDCEGDVFYDAVSEQG